MPARRTLSSCARNASWVAQTPACGAWGKFTGAGRTWQLWSCSTNSLCKLGHSRACADSCCSQDRISGQAYNRELVPGRACSLQAGPEQGVRRPQLAALGVVARVTLRRRHGRLGGAHVQELQGIRVRRGQLRVHWRLRVRLAQAPHIARVPGGKSSSACAHTPGAECGEAATAKRLEAAGMRALASSTAGQRGCVQR